MRGVAGRDTGEMPMEVFAARLGRAVVLLQRQMRRHTPSELTMTQLSLLATVVRRGPLGVGQLADAETLPSPAMTRLVDKLESDGLVIRTTNPKDRRGVLVAATEAGRDAFAAHERAGNRWLTERLSSLDPQQLGELVRAIELFEALTSEDGETPGGGRPRAGAGKTEVTP